MGRPQIRECELAHAVQTSVSHEDLVDDFGDSLSLEIQRLTEIRQDLRKDVDELLESCSCYAIVVIFGDVKVSINELVISVARWKFCEDQHC